MILLYYAHGGPEQIEKDNKIKNLFFSHCSDDQYNIIKYDHTRDTGKTTTYLYDAEVAAAATFYGILQ